LDEARHTLAAKQIGRMRFAISDTQNVARWFSESTEDQRAFCNFGGRHGSNIFNWQRFVPLKSVNRGPVSGIH
jgi:hypothetical protein